MEPNHDDPPPPGPGAAAACPTPVFIGGSMRSGTTLLQRILCSAPGANPLIGECHYLAMLLDQNAILGASFDAMLGDYFDSPQAFADHMRCRAEAFLRMTLARHRPTQALVLKSPELTRNFPTLADWFPAACFIVMMRDPRDIIASMLDVGERHRAASVPSLFVASGRDVAALVRLYRSYYAPLGQAWTRLAGRTLVLRYEDLVRDPATSLARLTAFTGLTLRAEHLQPMPDRVSRRSATGAQDDGFVAGFLTPLLAEAPRTSRIGRYRERLTPEEIGYIEEHCATIAGPTAKYRYW